MFIFHIQINHFDTYRPINKLCLHSKLLSERRCVMELNEIINRISMLRTKAGLSARELSMRIGKNEAYINRLESRKNFEPSISVINDIAEACGSNLEEFFYYDINQYKSDKKIIELLKCVPESKKSAWIELLSNQR